MSYCRPSDPDSDIGIYFLRKEFVCRTEDGPCAKMKTRTELLAHVWEHSAKGHMVPNHLTTLLERELAEHGESGWKKII